MLYGHRQDDGSVDDAYGDYEYVQFVDDDEYDDDHDHLDDDDDRYNDDKYKSLIGPSTNQEYATTCFLERSTRGDNSI